MLEVQLWKWDLASDGAVYNVTWLRSLHAGKMVLVMPDLVQAREGVVTTFKSGGDEPNVEVTDESDLTERLRVMLDQTEVNVFGLHIRSASSSRHVVPRPYLPLFSVKTTRC